MSIKKLSVKKIKAIKGGATCTYTTGKDGGGKCNLL
jgi:hypothetical protein